MAVRIIRIFRVIKLTRHTRLIRVIKVIGLLGLLRLLGLLGLLRLGLLFLNARILINDKRGVRAQRSLTKSSHSLTHSLRILNRSPLSV
jgi:hypothetical protein